MILILQLKSQLLCDIDQILQVYIINPGVFLSCEASVSSQFLCYERIVFQSLSRCVFRALFLLVRLSGWVWCKYLRAGAIVVCQ